MIAVGLALIAFTVGMVAAAWIYETDIRQYQLEAAQARRNEQAANQRASINAIHAQHRRQQ